MEHQLLLLQQQQADSSVATAECRRASRSSSHESAAEVPALVSPIRISPEIPPVRSGSTNCSPNSAANYEPGNSPVSRLRTVVASFASGAAAVAGDNATFPEVYNTATTATVRDQVREGAGGSPILQTNSGNLVEGVSLYSCPRNPCRESDPAAALRQPHTRVSSAAVVTADSTNDTTESIDINYCRSGNGRDPAPDCSSRSSRSSSRFGSITDLRAERCCGTSALQDTSLRLNVDPADKDGCQDTLERHLPDADETSVATGNTRLSCVKTVEEAFWHFGMIRDPPSAPRATPDAAYSSTKPMLQFRDSNEDCEDRTSARIPDRKGSVNYFSSNVVNQDESTGVLGRPTALDGDIAQRTHGGTSPAANPLCQHDCRCPSCRNNNASAPGRCTAQLPLPDPCVGIYDGPEDGDSAAEDATRQGTAACLRRSAGTLSHAGEGGGVSSSLDSTKNETEDAFELGSGAALFPRALLPSCLSSAAAAAALFFEEPPFSGREGNGLGMARARSRGAESDLAGEDNSCRVGSATARASDSRTHAAQLLAAAAHGAGDRADDTHRSADRASNTTNEDKNNKRANLSLEMTKHLGGSSLSVAAAAATLAANATSELLQPYGSTYTMYAGPGGAVAPGAMSTLEALDVYDEQQLQDMAFFYLKNHDPSSLPAAASQHQPLQAHRGVARQPPQPLPQSAAMAVQQQHVSSLYLQQSHSITPAASHCHGDDSASSRAHEALLNYCRDALCSGQRVHSPGTTGLALRGAPPRIPIAGYDSLGGLAAGRGGSSPTGRLHDGDGSRHDGNDAEDSQGRLKLHSERPTHSTVDSGSWCDFSVARRLERQIQQRHAFATAAESCLTATAGTQSPFRTPESGLIGKGASCAHRAATRGARGATRTPTTAASSDSGGSNTSWGGGRFHSKESLAPLSSQDLSAGSAQYDVSVPVGVDAATPTTRSSRYASKESLGLSSQTIGADTCCTAVLTEAGSSPPMARHYITSAGSRSMEEACSKKAVSSGVLQVPPAGLFSCSSASTTGDGAASMHRSSGMLRSSSDAASTHDGPELHGALAHSHSPLRASRQTGQEFCPGDEKRLDQLTSAEPSSGGISTANHQLASLEYLIASGSLEGQVQQRSSAQASWGLGNKDAHSTPKSPAAASAAATLQSILALTYGDDASQDPRQKGFSPEAGALALHAADLPLRPQRPAGAVDMTPALSSWKPVGAAKELPSTADCKHALSLPSGNLSLVSLETGRSNLHVPKNTSPVTRQPPRNSDSLPFCCSSTGTQLPPVVPKRTAPLTPFFALPPSTVPPAWIRAAATSMGASSSSTSMGASSSSTSSSVVLVFQRANVSPSAAAVIGGASGSRTVPSLDQPDESGSPSLESPPEATPQNSSDSNIAVAADPSNTLDSGPPLVNGAPPSSTPKTTGSAAHPKNCKPCAFFWTNGCANGEVCRFCHEWHPPKKKKPMKDQKNLMIIARPDGKIEFLRCTIQEAIRRS